MLRGESAATRLRPPDTYEFFLGGIGVPRDAAGHAAHGATPPDSLGWTGIPMYPGLEMFPSEMALRPPMAAWQPAGRAERARRPAARGGRPGGTGTPSTSRPAWCAARSPGGATPCSGSTASIPVPLLRVPQGARIVVRFHNALPMPSTVHWHGVRLNAQFDGVPGVSQPAVEPGQSFTYQLVFPDGGIFWYHPHVREDIQQDLGLYGNIFVMSPRPDAWGPVNREEFLMLDDLLVGDDGLVPWGADAPTHAAMGRFGNMLLVNGEPDWKLAVKRGAVVRFFLTNASNTRTFNLSFGAGAPGSRWWAPT